MKVDPVINRSKLGIKVLRLGISKKKNKMLCVFVGTIYYKRAATNERLEIRLKHKNAGILV